MGDRSSARDRTVRWLDERVGLDAVVRLGRRKMIPRHRHSLWYYLGGMTLFLFVVQVLSGILLTLYYRPSPDEAFESVRFITGEVSFGWLVRAVHGWAANLIVLVAMVHLASVFFLRAYRRPREGTWVTGMLLFLLFLGFGFSGYLLPWNQLSYFATRVGTEIPGSVPVIGETLVHVLRGGEDVTGATLSRFYGLHIAILPGLTTIVLGLHLYLVQKHGMSVPLGVEKTLAGREPDAMPFLPNFLLRDMVGWLGALGLLVGLASLLPEGDGLFVKLHLGEQADPFGATPPGLKPEWYFLAMFYSLKLLPGQLFGLEWLEGEQVGVVLFGLAGAFLFLVPFLDRRAARGARNRLFTAIGVIGILWLVVFTILGRISD